MTGNEIINVSPQSCLITSSKNKRKFYFIIWKPWKRCLITAGLPTYLPTHMRICIRACERSLLAYAHMCVLSNLSAAAPTDAGFFIRFLATFHSGHLGTLFLNHYKRALCQELFHQFKTAYKTIQISFNAFNMNFLQHALIVTILTAMVVSQTHACSMRKRQS